MAETKESPKDESPDPDQNQAKEWAQSGSDHLERQSDVDGLV